MVFTSRRCMPLKWGTLLNQKYFKRDLSFQDLGINIKLTRVLRSKGIRNPSDIQEKAIQRFLEGNNIVINSETGSGKTLAYALPIVNNIHEIKKKGLRMPSPYGLIVVPNIELQHQVSNVFSRLLGANVCPANEDSPLRLLNTDVVVSTAAFLMTYPLDVFSQVQTVVFDEADIMIAKKVGKHGRKDPLFKLIKQLIEPSHFQCLNVGDNIINVGDNIFNVGENILNVGDKRSNIGGNSINIGDTILNIEDNRSYIGDNKPTNGDNRSNNGDSRSDNAGNCLDIGLDVEDSKRIFRDNRQFVFVGATMPDNEARKSKVAMRYIQSWVPDINTIQSENVHKLVSNVEMVYSNVLQGNKLKLLVQTLKGFSKLQKLRVLLFVNKLDHATALHHSLTQFNYSISEDCLTNDNNFLEDLRRFHLDWEGRIHILHKNIRVSDRLEIFQQFSASHKCLVVTTDVASRGLDFPDVDIVIQYDFATNVIDVLHRAGRTGRMGKEGKVVNFVTEEDEKLAISIEEATKNGDSLENLFSRRRSLQRKIKRSEKRGDILIENATDIIEDSVICVNGIE